MIFLSEKYIDDRVGIYIIFGQAAENANIVDVANDGTDVFVAIPRELAEKVVAAHDEFREKLYAIFGSESRPAGNRTKTE